MPAAHEVQDEAPPAEYLPVTQFAHIASTPTDAVPAGQAEQKEAESEEYKPAAQDPDSAVSPVEAQYLPPGHAVQLDCADEATKVPNPQLVQLMAPVVDP